MAAKNRQQLKNNWIAQKPRHHHLKAPSLSGDDADVMLFDLMEGIVQPLIFEEFSARVVGRRGRIEVGQGGARSARKSLRVLNHLILMVKWPLLHSFRKIMVQQHVSALWSGVLDVNKLLD